MPLKVRVDERSCANWCMWYGVFFAALMAIVFNDKHAFLFCMNGGYRVLNWLDNTPFDKTWNCYAGTAVEEFFQPLTADEVTQCHLNIPSTSGNIPSAFHNGTLFRIGSNQYFPTRASVHVWEGDSMLHAFKFNAETNSVSVNSAFLETPKLNIEKQFNQGIYSAGTEDLFMALNKDHDISNPSRWQRYVKLFKFFSGRFVDAHWLSPFDRNAPKLGLAESGDPKHRFHCANTDTIQWNNRLFATCEGSVFFEFSIDSETMEMNSIGFTNINDSWNEYPMIAHSRVDRFNNDNLIVIGHDTEKGNTLGVGMMDTESHLLNSAEIELNHAQEVHDMSFTEHYIIIFDFNLWFGMDLFAEYGTMLQFVNDSVSKSRFGIINKEEFAAGSDEVKWFEIEACMVFHMANAWEEGDEIVLIGPRQDRFDFNAILHHEVVRHKETYGHPVIYEWRLNLKTGSVIEGPVGVLQNNVEMPQMHPLFAGKKSKYLYFNLIDFGADGFGASSYGIIKYDVEKREIVGRIEYDHDGKFGSYEAVFVPKERSDVGKVKAEDDGYFVNVIWNKDTKESNIQIFDAVTMDPKPIAHVKLPYRIPGGFHSKFFY